MKLLYSVGIVALMIILASVIPRILRSKIIGESKSGRLDGPIVGFTSSRHDKNLKSGDDAYSMRKGFTLLELSVVLIIIALVTGMAVTSGVSVVASARLTSTKNKMAAIDQALMAFRVANNRLPCPGDLTFTSGNTNYGIEAANPGTCTGGTPAANFTAGLVCGTPEGALPAATIGLPADFMYDGWGNHFRYAVDLNATNTGAFTTMPASYAGPITVNDANGNARSTKSIYAVVSHGPNGHGAYTASGVPVNAASDNTNELINCHCSSSGVSTAYPATGYSVPTYVQQALFNNPSDAFNTFDDLVSFKERWQMLTPWDSISGSTTSTPTMASAAGTLQAFAGVDFSGTWTGDMFGLTFNNTTGIFNYLPSTNISPSNQFPGSPPTWAVPIVLPGNWSWDDNYVVTEDSSFSSALETLVFQRSGATLTQVAALSYATGHPAGTYIMGYGWSHSSQYLIIIYSDGSFDLYQVTKATNTFTPLYTANITLMQVYYPPVFTADDKYIISYYPDPWYTYAQINSGTITPVAMSTIISDAATGTFSGAPDFSLDGNYAVVLQDGSHIKVYKNSGNDLFVPLQTIAFTSAGGIGQPKWSPNGQYFAFGCNLNPPELHIFKKCGTGFVEIPGGAQFLAGTWGSSYITWSADSQYLGVVAAQSSGNMIEIFQAPNFAAIAVPPGPVPYAASAWAFRHTNNP